MTDLRVESCAMHLGCFNIVQVPDHLVLEVRPSCTAQIGRRSVPLCLSCSIGSGKALIDNIVNFDRTEGAIAELSRVLKVRKRFKAPLLAYGSLMPTASVRKF